MLSIKNTERGRRAEKGVQRVHIFGKDQKQWKTYLSCGENKESLLAFLCEHWRSCTSLRLGGISTMYVTEKEKCYVISLGDSDDESVGSEVLPILQSNHEEADTRSLLHAKHATAAHDFQQIPNWSN